MTQSQLLSISFYQLEVFFSLAETLNFTQTALDLNSTQPSVSRTLSKLEDAVGMCLFQRTTKSVTLTPMGKACYQSWQGVLETLNQGYAKANAKQTAYEGEISIGVSHLLNCDTLYSQYFKPFRETHKNIKINIVDVGLEDALIENSVDVMLMPIVQKYRLDSNCFKWRHVKQEPLYILVSDKHPFAQCKSICMQDILNTPNLVLSPEVSSNPYESLQDLYRPFGVAPVVECYFRSNHEIEALLSDGRRMCIIGEFFPSASIINTIKIPISDQHSGIMALWHNQCKNPHIAIFIESL